MRPLLVISISVWALSVVGNPCIAGDNEFPKTTVKTYRASDKFVRGLVNIASSPLEIPRRIRQRTEGGNTVRNWVTGTTLGVGYAVTRLLAGAYEVLTFPVPAPKQYTPIIEPEYVWETDKR